MEAEVRKKELGSEGPEETKRRCGGKHVMHC